MKFVNMLLVAMVVVFLMSMHSYEACRLLHGEETLTMRMKKDVLQIRGCSNLNRPFFPLIKQILSGDPPSVTAVSIPMRSVLDPSSRILRGQRCESKVLKVGSSGLVLGFDGGHRGE
ncbi:unnamed protein product [Prunus brigantina]